MNSITINLTPAERTAMIDAAISELAERLYNEHRDDLQLVSKPRAAGILDVDADTMDAIKVPRVVLSPRIIRYSTLDIANFIAKRREK